MRALVLLLFVGLAFGQERSEPRLAVQEHGKAIYPPLAKQAWIEGQVRLRVEINEVGKVERTKMISGHPMLEKAANELVKTIKFSCDNCLKESRAFDYVIEFRFADAAQFEKSEPIAPDRFKVMTTPPVLCNGGCHPLSRGPQRLLAKLDNPLSIGVSEYAIPRFPLIAKQARINSDIWFKVQVGRDGSPITITALNGHPLVIDAAREALQQWRFTCAKCDWGKEFTHYITIAFHVDDRLQIDEVRYDFDFPNYLSVTVGPVHSPHPASTVR